MNIVWIEAKMNIKQSIIRYLHFFLNPFFYLLRAISRSAETAEISNNQGIHTAHSLYNKNYNYVAARTALQNDYYTMIFYPSQRMEALFFILKEKFGELLMKFHFLHEESNYNPLLGQTNPCGITGKRGTRTTIYRI